MSRLGASGVADQIRRGIMQGQFRLHDRLPPSRDLAANYGVARNTLRAALHTLEREGLVETRSGSGTYVVHNGDQTAPRDLINASPLALMDARFALEPHICRLCVMHGGQADFDELDQLCRTMEAATRDANTFSDADAQFHRKLAMTTRNDLLIWIMAQINSVRLREEWTLMRGLTLTEDVIELYNEQHRRLLGAIRSRQPEAAATYMKAHLETARLSLTRVAET